MFNGIFSRKLLWCHKKQHTTLHMFGSCRSNSSCLTNQWPSLRSSRQVLKNFAKFIGKHLCQSLFFNKVVGLSPIFKNTFFTKHLTTTSVDSPKSVSLWCNGLYFNGCMLGSAVSVIFPQCLLFVSIFCRLQILLSYPIIMKKLERTIKSKLIFGKRRASSF